MGIHIRTNHHERQFKYRNEVPTKVLESEFNYQDKDVIDGYFCYHGVWYHLDQFMAFTSDVSDSEFKGWHGYLNDSYFSGVLIRLSDDGETYWVASYCQTSD